MFEDKKPLEPDAFETLLSKVKFKEESFAHKNEVWNKICAGVKDAEKPGRLHLLRIYYFAAAVVALLFMAAGLYRGMHVVRTTSDTEYSFLLPDDSRVTLYANSEISYNRLEWFFKRNAYLSGVADFEVMKGSRFDVSTDLGMVSVLGTQFTVDVTEELFQVICQEGSVLVQTEAGELVLKENEQMSYDKSEIIHKDYYMGYEEFDDASLSSVLSLLAAIYDVSFASEADFSTIKFSGFASREDLDEALEVISIVCSVEFQRAGKNINVILL